MHEERHMEEKIHLQDCAVCIRNNQCKWTRELGSWALLGSTLLFPLHQSKKGYPALSVAPLLTTAIH